MTWKTFGHKLAKSVLEKQLAAQKFSHAYLFSGTDGVGKKTLALELAAKILNTENLSTHPDFAMLSQEEGKEITIEPTLEFMSRLPLKPFWGKYKVAVIDNAHNLNLQASNALLKTLEEPSASTILMLISSRGTLLPTVASRCQVFFFQKFSPDELKDYCLQNHIELPANVAELSFGQLSRLKKMLSEKQFLQDCQDSVNNFALLEKAPLAEKFSAIAKFAELESPEFSSLLEHWVLWEGQQLTKQPQRYKIVQNLSAALADSRTNKNKKLILQGLFLKML